LQAYSWWNVPDLGFVLTKNAALPKRFTYSNGTSARFRSPTPQGAGCDLMHSLLQKDWRWNVRRIGYVAESGEEAGKSKYFFSFKAKLAQNGRGD
jgi:hypothetical protein